MEQLTNTINALTNQGFTYHHEATKYRYCRKDMIGTAEEYSGRFGSGFIVYLGRYYKSTNFCRIAYFTK